MRDNTPAAEVEARAADDGRPILVFVYGTLMLGHHNHHVMERAGGELLGAARTCSSDFVMVSCGGFPGVLYASTGKPQPWRGPASAASAQHYGQVVGELYSVATLGPLDALEGFPHHYSRRSMAVQLDGEPDRVPAWIYTLNGWTQNRPLVPGLDWAAYVQQQRDRVAFAQHARSATRRASGRF